jgi:predicted nucleic-acid-binding protein
MENQDKINVVDFFRECKDWNAFNRLSELSSKGINLAEISEEDKQSCFALLFAGGHEFSFYEKNINTIAKYGLIFTPELRIDMLKLVAHKGAYSRSLADMYYLLRNDELENKNIIEILNKKQNLTIKETKVILEQIDNMLDNLKLKRGNILDNIQNFLTPNPVYRSATDTKEKIVYRIENLSNLKNDFKDYLKIMEHKENKPSFLNNIIDLPSKLKELINVKEEKSNLQDKKPAG